MSRRTGLTLTGSGALMQRLQQAKSDIPSALHAATDEALKLIEAKAQHILQEEVYDKPHAAGDAPDASAPDSLYQSFVRELAETAGLGVTGQVRNTSPHAIFLEDGTDDEGTGHHFVPVVNGGALHWFNPLTGQPSFSKGHEVKGIVPIRFMHRALSESKPEVAVIFKRHLGPLWR